MDRHVGALDASAPALLQQLRAQGFELEARGDRLRIRPADRVTPELRDQLARHKAAILTALMPTEYVMLTGGLTLPLAALQLAWSLEDRHITLTTDTAHQLVIPQDARLTMADRAALERWRLHLAAIVEYEAAIQ